MLVAAALGLAACGGSSSTTTTTRPPPTRPRPARPPTGHATGPPGSSRHHRAPHRRHARATQPARALLRDARVPGKEGHHAPASAPPGAGRLPRRGGRAQLPKGMTRAQFAEALRAAAAASTATASATGQSAPTTPFTSPRFHAVLVRFAACLRQNGINVGEPNTSGKGPVFDTKGHQHRQPPVQSGEAKCRSTLLVGLRGRQSHSGSGRRRSGSRRLRICQASARPLASAAGAEPAVGGRGLRVADRRRARPGGDRRLRQRRDARDQLAPLRPAQLARHRQRRSRRRARRGRSVSGGHARGRARQEEVDVDVVPRGRERLRGGASGYFIRLTIRCGANRPRSVSSVRIAASVTVPGPWWPAIGTPLMAVMSTPPVERPGGRRSAGDARARGCSGARAARATQVRPSAAGRCGRGTAAPPARGRPRHPPPRPDGRTRRGRIPGSASTARSSPAVGHRQHVPGGRAEQRARAPRALRVQRRGRARSSSQAAAAGRSCRCRPPGAPRSAAVPTLAPAGVARWPSTVPSETIEPVRSASQRPEPVPVERRALRAAARASGLSGWAKSRTRPIPAGAVSAFGFAPAGPARCGVGSHLERHRRLVPGGRGQRGHRVVRRGRHAGRSPRGPRGGSGGRWSRGRRT